MAKETPEAAKIRRRNAHAVMADRLRQEFPDLPCLVDTTSCMVGKGYPHIHVALSHGTVRSWRINPMANIDQFRALCVMGDGDVVTGLEFEEAAMIAAAMLTILFNK